MEFAIPCLLPRMGDIAALHARGVIDSFLKLGEIGVWTDYWGCNATLNPSMLSLLYLNNDLFLSFTTTLTKMIDNRKYEIQTILTP